jgi:hypothetical protein
MEANDKRRGRKVKYDFTGLVNSGDTLEIYPEGKSFSSRQARVITSALSQYKRKYNPDGMYVTRSVFNEEGRKITKLIIILVK